MDQLFSPTVGKYKDGLCSHLDPMFLHKSS